MRRKHRAYGYLTVSVKMLFATTHCLFIVHIEYTENSLENSNTRTCITAFSCCDMVLLQHLDTRPKNAPIYTIVEFIV